MSSTIVAIPGYFCISDKYPTSLGNINLSFEHYAEGVQRLDLAGLEPVEVTSIWNHEKKPMRRRWGGFVFNLQVFGVIDTKAKSKEKPASKQGNQKTEQTKTTKGSLIPFFVEKRIYDYIVQQTNYARPADVIRL
ncbi:MAG: hypothetical protein OEX12_00195 [Gammaproteobacteria bacterium]|nr:hypothetical protein [Gammaproteobacteria bacterium]